MQCLLQQGLANGDWDSDEAVGDKLPIYRRTGNRWMPIATLLEKEGECAGERMGERLNTGGISGC
jgi:hypothetical protein